MAAKELKTLLKKIPGLRSFGRNMKEMVKDVQAIGNFLAERKVPRGTDPIKVGFLCQYIPIWHKLQPIYEMMLEDPRFEPVLICVPSGIQDSVLDPNSNADDTYEYFRTHGYSEAMNALQADGSWLDLEQLGLTYIFYPRPYDHFMPQPYWCKQVSRYCKICLILYGMNVTEEITKITLHRSFYRYVYCYFAEMPFSRDVNARNGWIAHALGFQQSVYYGMPGIEAILASRDQKSAAWDFSKNDFRVMWTPRWTTDLSCGGSNFFTYYRVLIDLARERPDMDFLFRPHPLAIAHFLETGELTQEEADWFYDQCRQLPNISLDSQKEYTDTLWGTSVLITDISGLMPEYFATGKPMIFCASNMILTPERSTRKMLEVTYIAHNREELLQYLSQLRCGIDPLAERRRTVVQELFPEAECHPAHQIVEHLAKHS